jgi:hypothetical protein
MKHKAITLPRRYPGLKPFERSQQAVFHGRQEDVQRLSNLILRERLVILFAKSGIGKTSLLQAGVAPELERQDFVPILLRTERTDKPILESLQSVLINAPELGGRDTTGERPGQPQTLWEQMKRLEYDLNGLPAIPVLVFDQFEEAFTLSHSEKSRSQFLNELADLVNGTMPEALRSELLRSFHAGEINMETMQWWEEQPDLRIVMSIRSDFLHMIDRMSGRIPGILKNRYQLLPLDREKARIAIVMPASATGEFASATFQYTEPALTEMIDFLAGNSLDDKTGFTGDVQGMKRKEEIEAVNLQIVCMDVEERMIDYQKPAGFEVTPEFYDGESGLQSSIRNFYSNQLNGFPKAYVERILQKSQQAATISELDKNLTAREAEVLRDMAQRLIEESLITPGNRRNSVVDDTLLDEHDVTVDFLDTLVDKSRLLRKEPRLDDFYYEIGHDTLLPAIIESRNRRREKEKSDLEKAAYEARLTEEAQRREAIELELKTTRKQRKLARTVALTSFVSLLVSLAFGIWFVFDYIQSAREQLKTAEDNVFIEQYDAALRGYEDLVRHPRRRWVLTHSDPPKDIEQERTIVAALHKSYSAATDSLRQADGLMFNDNYALALTTYRHALTDIQAYKKQVLDHPRSLPKRLTTPRVDTNSINNQVSLLEKRQDNALQTLIREFKIAQRDFEVFNEAKVWGQALRNLERMHHLLPAHPKDQQDLQDALQLNTPIRPYVEAKMQECRRKITGQ